MKTYIVAVSGGIDSVVLLDLLSKQSDICLIVAHFDHGIRFDSALDAVFVNNLAINYGLKFESKRKELGINASEDLARKYRYKFLKDLADKYKASIVTAHHADDIIETIAINIKRGTGWRGVAVLDSSIVRPLLSYFKSDIVSYADSHNLIWREDPTNISKKYLRNRIRLDLNNKLNDNDKKRIINIWKLQCDLKHKIDQEIKISICKNNSYSRDLLIYMDDLLAEEYLRAFIMHESQQSPTRKQVKRALLAIKTAKPASRHDVGDGVVLLFSLTDFIVELRQN